MRATARPWRLLALVVCLGTSFLSAAAPIDRHALVSRHTIELERFDAQNPLQVGNGEFAFAVDATGLQTFAPGLGTYSQWAWHTAPKPENFRYEETLAEYDSHGRKARYAYPGPEMSERARAAYHWFRANPHRQHLGRIGFEFFQPDGSPASSEDLRNIRQTLDLWSGSVHSTYTIGGGAVDVTTCVHPRLDLVAVRVRSELIRAGRLKVFWHFPAMTPDAPARLAEPSYDTSTDAAHTTTVTRQDSSRVDLQRKADADTHLVSIAWSGAAQWTPLSTHRFLLTPARDGDEFGFVSQVSEAPIETLPEFHETLAACTAHWAEFWSSGGAVDLSQSRDPRWRELERRIVLSQYLTAIQSCGSSPPQESGLFSNSWFGKFHLEMTTWHGVHFALWGREHLLEGWLRWMRETGLPAARRQARAQGYSGARWLKMIDREASWESPSSIGVFRLTQQGHAIFWAELMYRLRPERATLETWHDVVFESANFMADFVSWDENTQRYVLGPPLISGSEATRGPETFNSTVELSYWFYGLRTAQRWRERLDLDRNETWDQVLARLSEPPVRDGVYLDVESHPENWKGRPAWLEALGCMPGVEIDPATMARTVDRITQDLGAWQLWGADFPMFAMTAARLDRPQAAIDLLLTDHPQNAYSRNGFNTGGSTPYLPAHGGLLWAVALMAAGWDGAPDRPAPGFPADGSWVVRWEGLRRAP